MEERSWFVVVGKMNLEEDKWEISSGSPFFKDPGQVTPRPNASDNTHPHTKVKSMSGKHCEHWFLLKYISETKKIFGELRKHKW